MSSGLVYTETTIYEGRAVLVLGHGPCQLLFSKSDTYPLAAPKDNHVVGRGRRSTQSRSYPKTFLWLCLCLLPTATNDTDNIVAKRGSCRVDTAKCVQLGALT
uniref:Uncharacterized protein n=1 Tax=Panagrellus redivivus TaxID=6233 RepID=A0A7E4V446_PANRE